MLCDQATQCQIIEKLQPQSDSGTRITLFFETRTKFVFFVRVFINHYISYYKVTICVMAMYLS